MNEFFKIEYVDAKYYIGENIPECFELAVMKTFGKVRQNSEDDYVVEYVNTNNIYFENKISEGIVIPKGSLFSEYSNKSFHKKCDMEKFKVLDKIEVVWKDVVHVVDSNIDLCSIMKTVGIFEKDFDDFILIKNPVTIKEIKLEYIKHPNFDVLYYIIPKSFILNINKI